MTANEVAIAGCESTHKAYHVLMESCKNRYISYFIFSQHVKDIFPKWTDYLYNWFLLLIKVFSSVLGNIFLFEFLFNVSRQGYSAAQKVNASCNWRPFILERRCVTTRPLIKSTILYRRKSQTSQPVINTLRGCYIYYLKGTSYILRA